MFDDQKATDFSGHHPESTNAHEISRRHFLRIVGMASATVGAGAGLGGLLAACGGGTSSTTGTTAGTTTTAIATTTTTAGATTSASGAVATTASIAGPELGREVKAGYIIAKTGMQAALGQVDPYLADKFTAAIGDGIVMGDKKKHPVSILITDNQSSADRAAQVTGDLIMNSHVDLIVTNSAGELVNAVSDQAEANSTPSLSTECPFEIFWFGRNVPARGGLKWNFNASFGLADTVAESFAMYATVPTNKIVGALWPNDAEGNTFRTTFPDLFKKAGYTVVDPGSFQDGLEDFTSIIQKFKQAGAEVVHGIMPPPDFTTFWKQCYQMSFLPKIADVTKPTAFPAAMEALGNIGYGLACPIWWHPTFPFKSPLTGQTAQEFADEYETKTGKEWVNPLQHFLLFEWLADVLTRTTNVDDKQTIVSAIKTTKMESIDGPIDFTEAVGASFRHPVENCVTTACGYGQWVKGKKWPFEPVICANGEWKMIPVSAKFQPLSAFRS